MVNKSSRINLLTGKYPGPGNFVVGKDIILKIPADYVTEVGLYKAVESAEVFVGRKGKTYQQERIRLESIWSRGK
ncbi:MAG: hypothetical protein KKH04_13550 [Proteobacteria bacterium]|nr:hypothetical protein [Pseudomonadota bacterium]